MEELMLAFDSDLAPAVGQQVTLGGRPTAEEVARARLLLARASAPYTSLELGGAVTQCDVVVHLRVGTRQAGLLYEPASGRFLPDTAAFGPIPLATLASYLRASGNVATLTCVPPGEGMRVALDRDLDGVLNGDE